MKIQIVEDNRDAAEVLRLLVTGWGHETTVTHDGAQAVTTATAWRPNVVLLDIALPRMHGHDVVQQLRATDWGKETTVIAVSAWARDSDVAAGKAAGIDHHLVKPVNTKKLRKLLDRAANALPQGAS